MPAPLPISVCLISGPDAYRIGRALESVRGWVSDIVVVVNDDVADGTDKIAEQHGARVFREKWKEHIAQKIRLQIKLSNPGFSVSIPTRRFPPSSRIRFTAFFFHRKRMDRLL